MGHGEINKMFQDYRAVYVGGKISKPGSLDFSKLNKQGDNIQP